MERRTTSPSRGQTTNCSCRSRRPSRSSLPRKTAAQARAQAALHFPTSSQERQNAGRVRPGQPVAPSRSTVLIHGESERARNSSPRQSIRHPRRTKRLFDQYGSIPVDLLESQLLATCEERLPAQWPRRKGFSRSPIKARFFSMKFPRSARKRRLNFFA